MEVQIKRKRLQWSDHVVRMTLKQATKKSPKKERDRERDNKNKKVDILSVTSLTDTSELNKTTGIQN